MGCCGRTRNYIGIQPQQLVLLVGWGRLMLWTITAFTLGHSLTLALAALGVVNVPQAPGGKACSRATRTFF